MNIMRKLIVANWKLNLPNINAWKNFRAPKDIDVVVCPPFPYLRDVSNIMRGGNVELGAQDVFWEESGAYTGEVSAKMIGGPLFIAREAGRQARRGAVFLFSFMALISINLAVLNVLPIPVLDGGHLVFLLVEAIKGSPLSVRARMIAQQVGLAFLLVLIVLVTYNDIMRFVGEF